MKWILFFASIILCISNAVYAIEPATTAEGAQEYDWQTCVNNKRDECVTSTCSTSEDKDCQDNCGELAEDKCLTLGLNPP